MTPTTTIQGQVPSTTPTWVPVAVAVGGAAIVGLLVYAFMRKPASTSSTGAAESPPTKLYARWRAETAGILLNQYGLSHQTVTHIFDMPSPSGESVAVEFYNMHATPSQAAQRIASTYQRALRPHG